MAEVNHNPGKNPKAGQDIAASQVRLDGFCYSFPWGCLKHKGACRYLGMAISPSLTLLPHNLLQTKPAPSPLGLYAFLLPQEEVAEVPNPSHRSVPRELLCGHLSWSPARSQGQSTHSAGCDD